jgi:hypothetical protein
LELEVSHQMVAAINDVDLNYALLQTRFNGRVAAKEEVDAVRTRFEVGEITVDLLLDAQRRLADAETAYYQSIVDYNRAIMRVHYRKGSLLDYDGVFLAEGPWPGKAYFDALRQARKRDAATYFDYGFTRPNVFSQGAYQQNCIDGCEVGAPQDARGFGPAPEEALPIGPGEQEYLPMPAEGLPMMAPPGNNTGGIPSQPTYQSAARRPGASGTRSTANEHQTNNPFAATAAASSVGPWGGR